MRTRITRAFLTAAAAGATIATVGFTAAAPAGAAAARPAQASMPVITTTSFGGYEASGRSFRYINALIRVPDMSQNGLYPQAYVQLSNGSVANGDTYTRAGIETCIVAQFVNPNFTCPVGTQWVGFIEAWHNSILGPFFTHFVPLNLVQGDGVWFSVYFDQAGNEYHYVLTPPTVESCSTGPQNQCYYDHQAFGPILDHAGFLADYTNATGTPVPLPIWAEPFRLTQFLGAALTTYSGQMGSLVGPWTTSMVQATSNGQPFPQGSVRLSPSQPWTDGIASNGAVRNSDAFGLWRRVDA